MPSVDDGVRIFHIRVYDGPTKDVLLPKGGITVAIRPAAGLPEDHIYAAIGVCGFRHTYNRKLGCDVAVGRLTKVRLTKTREKFADVFLSTRFSRDSEFERALTIAHILLSQSSLKGRQYRTAAAAIETSRQHRYFLGVAGDPVMPNPKFDAALIFAGKTSGRYDSSKENISNG